jgi:hypothetical protein
MRARAICRRKSTRVHPLEMVIFVTEVRGTVAGLQPPRLLTGENPDLATRGFPCPVVGPTAAQLQVVL